MELRSPVLLELAELYEDSAAARIEPASSTLNGHRGAAPGGAVFRRRCAELAESELRAADEAGVIRWSPIHRRDPHHFAKVRLCPADEAAFFTYVGLASPRAARGMGGAFRRKSAWPVPAISRKHGRPFVSALLRRRCIGAE